MAERDELETILRSGREGRSTEFKQSMSWDDDATRAKVVRAALALANLRDGGVIAFGLEAQAGSPLLQLIGMPQAHHDSFTQDSVSATVNTHATPYIDLSVEHLPIDGKLFVAIVVRQFSDYPVICAKDFNLGGRAALTRGRVYCRSRRLPETTEVQSPEDMREIIDLATNKGLERYFQHREIERRAGPGTSERFDAQIRDLIDE
jgi:predicted HTH transcriptional regulator